MPSTVSARTDRARFGMQTAWAAAALASFAVWLMFADAGDHSTRVIVDASFVVTPWAATYAAAWRARRERSRGWVFLAVGLFLWGLGGAAWLVTELVTASPPTFPSLGDVGYLSYAVPVAVGLMSFPLLSVRETSRWWTGLDVLVVASSMLFISWATVMGPALTTDGLNILQRALFGAYPVKDVVLASLVLSLAIRARVQDRGRWALLGAAIAVLAVTDHAYSIQGEAYQQGTLLDLGWAIGFVLFMLAALTPAGAAPAPGVNERTWSRVTRQAVPYIPVTGAVVTALAAQVTDDPVLIFVGAVALLLFLVREFAVLLDNARLTVDLGWRVQSRTAELDLLRVVAATSNESDSIEGALVRVLRAVCHYAEWQVGHAYLLSEASSRRLQDTNTWYSDDLPRYQALIDATASARLREEYGLPGQVVATGAALWHDDIEALPTTARHQALRESGLVAAVAVPVTVDGVVVAVIEFFGTQHARRDDKLLNVLSDVVNQLGRVIEREQAQSALRHQVDHDSLTKLPNRNLFRDRLERSLHRLSRRSGNVAVLLIDLDRFKEINDTLGHAVGDEVLMEAASRLRTHVRPVDTVARLGGDEFAIVVEDESDGGAAERVAAAVLEGMAVPMMVAGRFLTITASVGVAVVDDDEARSGVGDMLRNADRAMYRAKRAGEGRAVFFEPDWHPESVARLECETALRQAVERRDFEVYYQPVTDLATARIVGTEALLRWFHAERGFISVNDFIPLAEETGLILPLGEWVLDEALRQTRRWQTSQDGHRDLSVAVNVSVKQLRPGFAERVAELLRDHDFEPACLTVEVTESILVPQETAVVRVLEQISRLGIKIAVDDFGTGYSALHRLRQFPVDIVKIDKSFVAQIGEPAGDPLITAMIALGHGLGLQVVAEGIESAPQLQFLAERQCDLGQGFFMSRPVPAVELESLLSRTPDITDLVATTGDRPFDSLDARLLHLITTAMEGDLELEGLVRPILTKLEQITGLESTYVTQIHWDAGTQSIKIARNVGTLNIPEGTVVPWAETLCQHAVPCGASTVDVPALFPDSTAAVEIGIRSYTGVPIHDGNGAVYGTLCGASSEQVPQAVENIELMKLFARVIGHLIASQPAADPVIS